MANDTSSDLGHRPVVSRHAWLAARMTLLAKEQGGLREAGGRYHDEYED